jgi:hypothetical protein
MNLELSFPKAIGDHPICISSQFRFSDDVFCYYINGWAYYHIERRFADFMLDYRLILWNIKSTGTQRENQRDSLAVDYLLDHLKWIKPKFGYRVRASAVLFHGITTDGIQYVGHSSLFGQAGWVIELEPIVMVIL